MDVTSAKESSLTQSETKSKGRFDPMRICNCEYQTSTAQRIVYLQERAKMLVHSCTHHTSDTQPPTSQSSALSLANMAQISGVQHVLDLGQSDQKSKVAPRLCRAEYQGTVPVSSVLHSIYLA